MKCDEQGKRRAEVEKHKAPVKEKFKEFFLSIYDEELKAGRCARGAFQMAKLKTVQASKSWGTPQERTLVQAVRMEFIDALSKLFNNNDNTLSSNLDGLKGPVLANQ